MKPNLKCLFYSVALPGKKLSELNLLLTNGIYHQLGAISLSMIWDLDKHISNTFYNPKLNLIFLQLFS